MRSVFLFCFIHAALFGVSTYEKKILICGVCRNVEPACEITIENMELLGTFFADYHVIIYENNSTDKTSRIFAEWAKRIRKSRLFRRI